VVRRDDVIVGHAVGEAAVGGAGGAHRLHERVGPAAGGGALDVVAGGVAGRGPGQADLAAAGRGGEAGGNRGRRGGGDDDVVEHRRGQGQVLVTGDGQADQDLRAQAHRHRRADGGEGDAVGGPGAGDVGAGPGQAHPAGRRGGPRERLGGGAVEGDAGLEAEAVH